VQHSGNSLKKALQKSKTQQKMIAQRVLCKPVCRHCSTGVNLRIYIQRFSYGLCTRLNVCDFKVKYLFFQMVKYWLLHLHSCICQTLWVKAVALHSRWWWYSYLL